MHKAITLVALIAVLFCATEAYARVKSDDCPVGSTDPDCATAPATPAPPGK
jgi:hypothetical protein